ncbi:MAG TPA: hypothetical protein VF666_05655 [Pyrinomonadaceae bacterium]
MSEDDYYEQLLIAKDKLIDDFVSDKLSEPKRATFARRFLSVPELRQDVRFAGALRKHAAESALRASSKERTERPRPFLLSPLVAFFRRPAVGFSLSAALLLGRRPHRMDGQTKSPTARTSRADADATDPPASFSDAFSAVSL